MLEEYRETLERELEKVNRCLSALKGQGRNKYHRSVPIMESYQISVEAMERLP